MKYNARLMFIHEKKCIPEQKCSTDHDKKVYDESYFADSKRIVDLMFAAGRSRGLARPVPMRGKVFGMSETQPPITDSAGTTRTDLDDSEN